MAAAHGRFSRIRQVAPMCTTSNTWFVGPTLVHIPNGISMGALKTRDWKTRNWKTQHQTAGLENARLENARTDWLWKAAQS